MQYMLLIYGNEGAAESHSEGLSPEQMTAEMQVWFDYSDWLRDQGWYVAGDALEPSSTATTVRAPEGEAVVTDGPFAETKEQLGGYYLIETANLDEAIEAAGRCPGTRWGTVEVRPVMGMPERPEG
ncbi:MAG TPA: YciI family protein [Actinomycetota bacterium]|jgi:hypothetical protein